MQTVSFTKMADGTKEDYEFLSKLEKAHNESLGERIMQALSNLEHSFGGYKVSRLGHSLQSATMAYRAGEEEELVIAALVHDLGDDLAPYAHSEFAAAILKPYVSDEVYWVIKHHGLFQMYYYAHHLNKDGDARELFKDHRYYKATVSFCENYDQNCFDPDYDTLPLEFFRPMVIEFFSQPPKIQL